jgi:hypothetical protein
MKNFLIALLIICAAPALARNFVARSEYTSLDAGCKVLRHATAHEPLPDSFESICPGRDGMRVISEGGDARSWISLVPRGAKSDQGTRSFPQITGKRLEWRYSGSKLVALIVRNSWTDDDSKNYPA